MYAETQATSHGQFDLMAFDSLKAHIAQIAITYVKYMYIRSILYYQVGLCSRMSVRYLMYGFVIFARKGPGTLAGYL